MIEARTVLYNFISNWKAKYAPRNDMTPEQAILCQNDWMASEQFGEIYGWRLEPQNDGQRRIYDELRQHKARLEEELRKETSERRLRMMKGEPEE